MGIWSGRTQARSISRGRTETRPLRLRSPGRSAAGVDSGEIGLELELEMRYLPMRNFRRTGALVAASGTMR